MKIIRKINSFQTEVKKQGSFKKAFSTLRPQRQFSLTDFELTDLPPLELVAFFKDTKKDKDKNTELLKLKMKACQRLFSWQEGETQSNDPQFKQKELKARHLIDLIDFVNANPVGYFKPEIFADIIEFVSVNIFSRTNGNSVPSRVQADPEEEVQFIELSWPHLQFVIEFLLRFVVSEEVAADQANEYIDETFITKLLGLFDSQDERERDGAKAILYSIYGKFVSHRAFIRRSINDIFYQYILYSGVHNGVCELLEIIGAIVAGLAVPIKEEHKIFLRHILIPLHTPKQFPIYSSQLLFCINQFCQKDILLLKEVILGLIRFWPNTNPQKIVLFLIEIEEILQSANLDLLDDLITPIYTILNNCIMSKHFQVAERTSIFLTNPTIMKWTLKNKQITFPLLYEGLSTNLNKHWNTRVHEQSFNLVKIFNENDSELFLDCAKHAQEKIDLEKKRNEESENKWKELEQMAKSVEPKFQLRSIERRSVLDIDSGLNIEFLSAGKNDISVYNPMYSKSRYARLESVFV